MFDVVASNDIEITEISFQFDGGVGQRYPYVLYKRKDFGSYEPVRLYPTQWELVASGSAVAAAAGATTDTFSVSIPKGETQAFYIQGRNQLLISRWSGSNGDTMFANDDMSITRGCALAQGSDFNNKFDKQPAGGVVSVRYKNKIDCQTSAPSPSPSSHPTDSPSAHPTKSPTQRPTTKRPSMSPT
jgi:hypothetical protein